MEEKVIRSESCNESLCSTTFIVDSEDNINYTVRMKAEGIGESSNIILSPVIGMFLRP